MQALLLVGLGGAFGSICRYLLNLGVARAFGPAMDLPLGTWIANILGGLLMGMLVAALTLRGEGDQERWRLLLGVGVLGGFTTFSSFALETAEMIQRRYWETAAVYVVTSVAASVCGVFLGMFLMRKLLA